MNPEHHLQETDELFAAGMKETVTPRSAKPLWEDMEHEQIEKIFPGDGPGPVLPGFGMKIPDKTEKRWLSNEFTKTEG